MLGSLLTPGPLALRLHRRARTSFRQGNVEKANRVAMLARLLTGIEIAPAATIGRGSKIWHGHGIVIGEGAVIGDDCIIFQGVTVGRSGFGKPFPRIGDRVTIFSGAAVIGPVVVGNNATIGANAVVTHDVPAGATVGGVPARVLKAAGGARSHRDVGHRDNDAALTDA